MKYSIITINFNNREGLQRTIESVKNQTFRDYEHIVIDGGSTDGSVDIIKSYHKDISYWISEKDNGIYQAMNKGILIARGDYLNFMNSGDVFFDQDVLACVYNELENVDILVGKDYHYSKEKKEGFASILPTRISMITFFMETLPHQSAFIKRKLFDDSLYNENFKICADWAFYIKKIVEEGCNVKLFPAIICQREPGGMSAIQIDELKKERMSFLRHFLPKGVYQDYETMASLDRSTLYKLMSICKNEKSCKFLTICIKIIYRIFFK